MKLANSHISYCSNIHPGEAWPDHFQELKKHLPKIKAAVSPDQNFGLGLRLSAQAAEDLKDPQKLLEFKIWLKDNGIYVFTMNGFPYGDFHIKEVKDQVHAPDWTSAERFQYTKTLFDLLNELLENGQEGGISTSPLSYRFWFEDKSQAWKSKRDLCTKNILLIAEYLFQKEVSTGKYMHLDIEPEPDGMLEDSQEFIEWYSEELIPMAISYFQEKEKLDADQAKAIINRYICLCYDVCHFALEYEDHEKCMAKLEELKIKIGKFQVSSALKVKLSEDSETRENQKNKLKEFNEPIYLHQVIAKDSTGNLIKYKDLPDALNDSNDSTHVEWRSHFHVPIFLESYGKLDSTQEDILKVVRLHNEKQRTNHIEVETYTWGVLPKTLQVPIEESISREINWLVEKIKS
ncbi:metabolite traffic protein EboE [Sphingobacterium daejeonense]|uniref:Metabolite traffic protein EboE n=1 Tax=Sphingobacterium daejeonense TaxID=371142 RepID=A0ABW3RIE4_9SPHI